MRLGDIEKKVLELKIAAWNRNKYYGKLQELKELILTIIEEMETTDEEA